MRVFIIFFLQFTLVAEVLHIRLGALYIFCIYLFIVPTNEAVLTPTLAVNLSNERVVKYFIVTPAGV